MDWQGKRVVILGLARQGTALAQYLERRGARVVVSDTKPAPALQDPLASLRNLPIEYALGGHPTTLLDGADLLCISGGVPAGVPLAQEARRRGIPVSNDSQVFLDAAPCTVVGITGSAGKTTTTTLTGRMAAQGAAAGRATWVGGNIGNPLIADLERMKPGDVAVMELSSFQLEIMTASPQVAGVLNLTPNHLDRHGSMAAYIDAKSRILRSQSRDGLAVLGREDENVRALAARTPGRVWWFSAVEEVPAGTFLRGETLFLRDGNRETPLCAVSDIRLRGTHNLLNVLAACALSAAVDTAPEAMRQAVHTFTGVPHRLELVREREGVKWYNDSIATAPERVVAALKAFDEPIVLLAGGRDKKLPWDELARVARQKVKTLIAFGECAGLIEQAAEAENEQVSDRQYKTRPRLLKVIRVPRLADAVQRAAEIAQTGEVVLLSPGGTSFDEFTDFEQRGQRFRELVNQL
jgi:UDP-N-acetylmuramoylalanine--D-glutamate ligase